MGFLSTIGNLAKKAAPLAGMAASFIPGGGAVSGAIKALGGGGTLQKIGGWLGNNAGKIAGVAGATAAAQQAAGGQKMQNQAIQMAQKEYDSRAPIRQRQKQILLGQGAQRQDLSGTYGTVGRGAAVPGQVSGAQRGLAEQTDRAATGVANSQVQPFRAIDARDTSQAQRLAGQAEGEVGGARVRASGPIAGTDFSRARGEMGEMRLGDKMQIAGTDLGRAREISGMGLSEVGNAKLKEFASIDPTDVRDPRRLLGQAEGRYSGLGYEDQEEIAAGTYRPGQQQNLAKRLSTRALTDLAGAPSREEIATSVFDTLEERSRPKFEQDLRTVGQKAAAFGRIGAGMTTNDLTGVLGQRERDLRLSRQELSNDAAARDLEDRTSRLNSTLGAQGQYTSEDLATAGFERSLRDEARGEREFGVGMEDRRNNLELQKANLDRNLSADSLGINRTVRQDLVGERGFQADRDAMAADLALRRAESYRGFGSQEGDFASTERRDRESDRAYDLDYDTRAAGLAGQRAGMESRFAEVGRADSESDRSYDFNVGSRNADLNLSRSSAYRGLGSDEFSRGSSLRAEDRGERSDLLDYDNQAFGRSRDALSSLAGLEGQRFGQEGALRDEARYERGYGDSRSDLQTDRNIQQRNQEEDLQNSEESRRMALIQALGGAGGELPIREMLSLGSERTGDAYGAMDAAGELLGRQDARAPSSPRISTARSTPLVASRGGGGPIRRIQNASSGLGGNLDLRQRLPRRA